MTIGQTTSGFTVWFTGMSGAGKSTLAQGFANRLRRLGKSVDILDGQEVGQMLAIGHAMTKDERNAEVRKLAWVCKLVTRGGGIILQAAVESPYREARDEARRQIGRFAEVFVECPTETLISRDRSGRYKKALAGELKTLPGITEPYEPPGHPEVVVDTSRMSVDQAVEHILGQLVAQRLLDPAFAAMKGRPRLQARITPPPAPPPPPVKKAEAPAAKKAAVVKLKKAPAKAGKAQRRAAPRKQAAARTARVSPRKAAGGKRKR
ncbi:MAG TPA: adenylyl-sulfate kinase [Myxococcales bacterium]|nr:adenylyl-sulfate kinase [Myxococcales bacterium]